MRKLPYAAGIALCIAAMAGFLAFRGNASAKNQKFDIETSIVEQGDVARIVSASGSVRALTTVEVGSQVSGQITELLADFNSEVTEGQIIARIDPQTFQTRVASAEADVASARAGLEVQRASIASAEATYDQAEKDFQRQKTLYDQDAIALSSLEDIERQLAVAKASLQVSQAQLKSSQAALSQREASLASAKVDLERSIIRSPINGVVIVRNVDVGQTVAASFSAPVLFQIAQDLGDIRIDAAVVEADIGGINAGDPAIFKVDAYPDQTFEGVVEQVRLSAELLQNVVTYTVVIAAQNPGGRLLPGMTANVEITAENRPNVLRVAESVTRFRPPADGPGVIEADTTGRGQRGEGGGGQGGGGQGGFGGGDEVLANLNIDETRMAAINEDMASVRDTIRASFQNSGGPPADRNELRQKAQVLTEKVLREHLTPEEFRTYQSAQASRPTVRMVTLYRRTEDGSLQPQQVGIGLSDGSYVEVLRNAEAGDEFVSRVVAQKAS